MNNATIINLPKIEDPRGNLTFIEAQRHIPFEIKRAYWIYDVPSGEKRGGHAFKEQEEFIIALSGSFDVVVYNGQHKKKYHLNRSHFGLYIPAGLWRSMINFSTNSLSLAQASTEFDERDYIRNIDEFCRFLEIKRPKPLRPNKFLDHYLNNNGKRNNFRFRSPSGTS